MTPTKSRKRPLLVKSSAPPPRTATTIRLEQILEGKPKQNKKSRRNFKKSKIAAPTLSSTKENERWSTLVSLNNNDDESSNRTSRQNVLASKGGLANVPGFRKATMPVKKPIRKKKTKNTNRGALPPTGGLKHDMNVSKSSSISNHQSIPVKNKQQRTKEEEEDKTKSIDEHEIVDLTSSSLPDDIHENQTQNTNIIKTSSSSKVGLKLVHGKRNNRNKAAVRRPIASMETAAIPIPLTESKASEELQLNPLLQELPPITKDTISTQAIPKTLAIIGKVVSTNDTLERLSTAASNTGRSTLTNDVGTDEGITRKPPPAYQRHSSIVTADKDSSKKPANNDNFVRLNMRNSAGSCRGARNKNKKPKRYSKQDYAYGQKDNNEKEGNHDDYKESKQRSQQSGGHFYASKMTGLDPLDDYVDGIFHHKSPNPKAGKQKPTIPVPNCARHQLPCKIVVVKKNTTGNKGRKFYACSMPRGEQCNHFQWADDTLEAARAQIAGNKSNSSFISRQVAAYVDRFRMLTVPELRDEAARRGLKKNGKKKELLFRLSLWVRDEIAKSVKEDGDGLTEVVVDIENSNEEEDRSSASSEDDDEDDISESSDELDFIEDDDTTTDQEMDAQVDKACLTGSQRLTDSLSSLFGHSSFRDGQEWAITRCLNKEKSLLVAPTGFGKSLCYALPAALLDGVCVVVSPLVSLIHDQLRALPPRIPAATLSGSISASKTAAIIDDIIQKRIKILFVSPERLASPSFQRLFRMKWNSESNQYERSFPEISLLCIDEAHCVSQWAHNFRPCFLRFHSILSLMNPQGILAITATAGPRVIDDICQTIGIETTKDQMHGIKVIERGRDNIDVTCRFVANQEERFSILSKILTNGPAEDTDKSYSQYYGSLAKGSVIVYVWRQKDTEVVAEHLTSSGVKGGVVVYHGGMDSKARTKSQSMFMRGKARICVATVAFGMGIDKADVVGVIHLYLSSSPEHYLQEIGRAGRDGRAAKAIALPVLDEVPRRHSLEHSSIISKSQIKSLLLAIRDAADRPVSETPRRSDQPLQVALPVKECVLGCDCKSETIETLLSLIEQIGGKDPALQVIGFNYDRAIIALKKRTLKRLAEKEPVVSSIQAVGECFNPPIGASEDDSKGVTSTQKLPDAFQKQFLAYSLGSYVFSVVDCATNLGPSAEPRHVFAALRRLQSANELEMALDTSESGRVFHLKLSSEGANFFQSNDFDSLANDLTNLIYNRFTSSILSGAGKVLDMSYIMDEVAISCESLEMHDSGKSKNLVRFQELVNSYFNGSLDERSHVISRLLPKSFSSVPMNDLQIDAFAVMRDLPLLATQPPEKPFVTKLGFHNTDYTALAIAKFLHGIDSPRAPLRVFRTHPLFGKWCECQFPLILESLEKVFMSEATNN